MNIFTTRQDAIDHAIAPALDKVTDFDLDAIFEATFTYDAARQGFVQTADEDEFWAAVQAAAVQHRLVWGEVEQTVVGDDDWSSATDSATLRLECRSDDGDWEVVDTDGLAGDAVAWDEAEPYRRVEQRLAAAHNLDASDLQVVTPW